MNDQVPNPSPLDKMPVNANAHSGVDCEPNIFAKPRLRHLHLLVQAGLMILVCALIFLGYVIVGWALIVGMLIGNLRWRNDPDFPDQQAR